MTVFELARRGRADMNIAVLALLLRAALALFVHGLRHPFRPGELSRRSGRVRVR